MAETDIYILKIELFFFKSETVIKIGIKIQTA